MFDRKSIKEYARFRLKQAHWIVVLVVAIAGLLGGMAANVASGGININFNISGNPGSLFSADQADPGVWDDADPGIWDEGADPGVWEDTEPELDLPETWEEFKGFLERPSWGVGFGLFVVIFLVVFLFIMSFSVLVNVFFSNIVTVGVRGWLLRYWRGETPSVSALFASFSIYKPALTAMLVRSIYVFLWSLLFVIPGIVKSYAYSMVPYIIYENPNLTPNQAVAISQKLTKGAKWKLFALDWSFFGWNLLSACTAGILGVLYVNPYMGVTYAGVYEQLKWEALQSGQLTWADFGQALPADAWTEPVADASASQWTDPTPEAE